MRTIRFSNILKAEELKLGVGFPLTKTSSNFVYATKHPEPGKVFLQRGFKSYGLTHPATFDALTIFEEENLDYHMHKKRCAHQEMRVRVLQLPRAQAAQHDGVFGALLGGRPRHPARLRLRAEVG